MGIEDCQQRTYAYKKRQRITTLNYLKTISFHEQTQPMIRMDDTAHLIPIETHVVVSTQYKYLLKQYKAFYRIISNITLQ